ncbi:MAG TPA: iron ABC transporter permease, partial [Rhizobiales bacterium]|nr:iron ABC transporter permease [Hyphomicrobiales bacterium]
MSVLSKSQRGPALAGVLIALFLALFLVVPVLNVIYVAFQDAGTGAFTIINFADFFSSSLFRESFYNSVYVSGMSVVIASLIALPLSYFTTRFNFS